MKLFKKTRFFLSKARIDIVGPESYERRLKVVSFERSVFLMNIVVVVVDRSMIRRIDYNRERNKIFFSTYNYGERYFTVVNLVNSIEQSVFFSYKYYDWNNRIGSRDCCDSSLVCRISEESGMSEGKNKDD